MRRPSVVALGFALSAVAGSATAGQAQQGAITYDRAVRYGFELPEQMRERVGDRIPGEEFATFLLLFSPTETVMLPAPEPEPEEERQAEGGFRRNRLDGLVTRMRMTSTARTDHESLEVAYVDLATGSITENRTFMGRAFLIEGSRPELEWQLTGEQSEFAGYMVMKALTQVDDLAVEAWFTPQIPIPGGPGEYGGLPGMILSLSIDEGRVIYSATGVQMASVDATAIQPPMSGEAISRDEYEAIVEEKLDEVEVLQSQRRRRPGGER